MGRRRDEKKPLWMIGSDVLITKGLPDLLRLIAEFEESDKDSGGKVQR